MPLLRLIPLLLIITACHRNLPPPRPNPFAVPAVIEFKLGGVNFKKSLELLPSDDSVSKSSLKVTAGMYDSIMQGLRISEPLDRRHHYATVFYLDKDLHTDSIIRYENILGLGVYTVNLSVMHFKLYLKKDGIFSPADNLTSKVVAIYCHDNNAIARHFVKVNKTPVTWLPVSDKTKEPVIIKYKHELTKKLEWLASEVSQSTNPIRITNDIYLIPLGDSIFIHQTWHQLEGFGRFSSNGLLVIRNGKALMVDTPMDNEKTERLTRYLEDTLAVKLAKLIIGHFHDDCLGGLSYIQSIGVESIANSLTIAKCRELGLPVPSTSFTGSLSFDFNGEPIICRYFGAGHTADNITVWLREKKILFGGCLIKSPDSKDLGNLSDAVVGDWAHTVRNIQNEYPDIKTVIPGHGGYGGMELLEHTIKLANSQNRRLN